jgi:hypothetical protein
VSRGPVRAVRLDDPGADAVSERVSVAPNDPVLPTPIASSSPCERIQASSAAYPASVARNCW